MGHDKYMGKKVFIRAVTYHYTGLVVSVDANTIDITEAAWIADSGRFSVAMADPQQMSEVEMYPVDRVVSISRGAIVDMCEIPSLPKVTK